MHILNWSEILNKTPSRGTILRNCSQTLSKMSATDVRKLTTCSSGHYTNYSIPYLKNTGMLFFEIVDIWGRDCSMNICTKQEIGPYPRVFVKVKTCILMGKGLFYSYILRATGLYPRVFVKK